MTLHSTLTVYITLICTSTVFILYLGIRIWMNRHNYSSIANFFLIYTAAIAIYCFGSAMSLTAVTLDQMKFWTIIQYIGLPASSPLGLLFIMKYLGMKVTNTKSIALLTIPFITFLLVMTNDSHHLHYQVFDVDPVLGFPYYYQEIGSWYAVHGIHVFGCMFVALLLLFSQWKETTRAYRPQLVALMFGQLVPMVTAFLYLIGLTPAGVDPVPMVLWLTSLTYLWAISSSRLFTIMPVAKNAIFNSINDGVIVLDGSHRLIEFNKASKENFPGLNKAMFGMDFKKLWIEMTGESFPLDLGNTVNVQEIQLTVDHTERIFQMHTSLLDEVKSSTGFLLIFTDITELKKLQILLERQAFYDELTRIHNRRAFMQQSEKDFGAAKAASLPFSVVLIDIDHFKKVNDTYGHHIGDELLVHVVKTCQSQLDENHFFARYGGEEFVLTLKGCSAFQAEELGNRLRHYLAAQPLITEEGAISVTLSMGVAEGTEHSLHQLLHQADMALYSAKQSGRDQVRLYSGSMEMSK